jgi:hypothetical protein
MRMMVEMEMEMEFKRQAKYSSRVARSKRSFYVSLLARYQPWKQTTWQHARLHILRE